MHFLSSKLVHELEVAFSYILDKQRVKEGQIWLQKLRNQRQFQLALGTFISRSQDYHKRLLAILQLQKRLTIQDIQTVWSLKQVYYGDSDKIAAKIAKIISLKQNIKMASEFLVFDPYQAGSAVCRQIQMVFNLLKYQDKAQIAMQYHFSNLYQYFIDAVNLSQSNEPCFFMIIVSLALFYQSALKNNSSYFQPISQHWRQIESKCSSSQIDGVFLIQFSIKQTIFNENMSYKQNTLLKFLNTLFCKRSQINMNYFSKCLSIIGKYGSILAIQRIRQQFIESILLQNVNLNNMMLVNIRIYGSHTVQLQNQMLDQDYNQLATRQVCNRFIKSIFSQYYQWLNQSYLVKKENQVLQILLALINYYNSPQLTNLHSLLPTLFQKVTTQIHNYLSISNFTNKQKNIFITYIDFLAKYKAQIELYQLPNIVDLFAKFSQICPTLSPFCDSFISQVWKQLTYLQLNQLSAFLQFHLQKINENEWAICFERYECFLRLAVYLEESNSYFSTCASNDSLLLCVLKSHSIICKYLKGNGQKIHVQLFHIFLSLSKSIMQNKQLKKDQKLYNELNIGFLVDKIERHLFLNEDTAVIVTFHRYHTQILAKCVNEQRQKWQIDQLDYTYRISLYLTQIDFASQLFSQNQLLQMRNQLGQKVIQFIKQISTLQSQKIRQARLWDKLQNLYHISKYVTQKMDIQSI